jgi:hypothetical protein
MHNTLLAVGTLTALFALAAPASAQMCGPGQQAQAASPQQGGGMMCGMMGRQAQDDPMADKPAQPQQRSGMCPCCRNMAMMRGGMMGQQPGQQPHMPGMQTPRQQ